MIETWRAVVGMEGVYEVSDMGRIRSVPRVIHCGRRLQGRILKPGRVRDRLQCTLFWNDIKQALYVHIAVLEAFVCRRPVGKIGCHRDGNALNNIPTNLYWGSPIDNTADALAHGTHPVGELHGMAKLTRVKVEDIRRRVGGLVSQQSIAAEFDMSNSTISRIVNKKLWRDDRMEHQP